MLVSLPISELQPGMFVDSVCKQRSDAKIKIKSRGMVRDQAIIAQLLSKGVMELKIDFSQSDIDVPEKYLPEAKEESKAPEKVVNSAIKKSVKPAVAEKSLEQEFAMAIQQFDQHSQQLKSLYNDLTIGAKLDVSLLNQVSNEIVDSVLRNSNAMAILSRLKDKDGYNWRHMINCTILMSVFAKYLGIKNEQIQQLALGAMLHDVGHTKLPQGIINKTENLNELEFKALKKHVVQSLGLVKGESGISPLVMDMILNHHERVDGSGYPRGLSGSKISKPARMMAIVDVYDAMTSERPHQNGEEPIHALRYLLANKHQFDAQLVQKFIKCLGVHPVGTIVRLTNDRLALVLEGNKQSPMKPKVKVFYNTKHKHHITGKDLDLHAVEDEIKVVASVRPSDYELNLSRLLRSHLLV
ncbi:HD-GYP domain-containing protein [Pseudoalteromonas sp. MTN2-4]|uniref:HD-GYP domain-containing protein n=1 Tax=Pseudoalteromonas sp. MTN2-4 TaxID=3056555 RepID=UPI0036F294EB